MVKNKIPIWENLKDYPEELKFVVSSLLGFADRCFQLRIWTLGEGPEIDSHYDSMLNFDDDISYLKYLIRRKEVRLTQEQIRAILRVHAMHNTFDRNLCEKDLPKGWISRHMYIINHPYWIKLSKQAQYALSLLRCLAPFKSLGGSAGDAELLSDHRRVAMDEIRTDEL